MLKLLGLLCISVVVIVLLLKKISSMRNQFEVDILKEKKRSETQIAETRKSADIAIEEVRKKAEAEIAEAYIKAEQKIREYKEYIESQREVLMEKDEKTLMIDTMIALGSLGERLAHTEEKIELVEIKQSNFLATNVDFKAATLESIRSLREDIDTMKSEMRDSCWNTDNVKSKIDSIYGTVDEAASKISDVHWEIRDIKSKIDSMQNTVDAIKSETNSIYYKVD